MWASVILLSLGLLVSSPAAPVVQDRRTCGDREKSELLSRLVRYESELKRRESLVVIRLGSDTPLPEAPHQEPMPAPALHRKIGTWLSGMKRSRLHPITPPLPDCRDISRRLESIERFHRSQMDWKDPRPEVHLGRLQAYRDQRTEVSGWIQALQAH